MSLQVKGHHLQPRDSHSATAFTLSQGITEVIIFGGEGSDLHELSATTVLRFGESILRCMFMTPHNASQQCVYVCVCVRKCVCACVWCMYLCVYVHVCMCVCVCAHVYVRVVCV